MLLTCRVWPATPPSILEVWMCCVVGYSSGLSFLLDDCQLVTAATPQNMSLLLKHVCWNPVLASIQAKILEILARLTVSSNLPPRFNPTEDHLPNPEKQRIISILEERTEKPRLNTEMQHLMRWKVWDDHSECMKTNKHAEMSQSQIAKYQNWCVWVYLLSPSSLRRASSSTRREPHSHVNVMWSCFFGYSWSGGPLARSYWWSFPGNGDLDSRMHPESGHCWT